MAFSILNGLFPQALGEISHASFIADPLEIANALAGEHL